MKQFKIGSGYKTRFGQCIYHAEEGIRVYENFLFRWLMFESHLIQSLINRRNPQKIHLNYICPMLLPIQYQSGNCLLLGLGGAALAHAAYPFCASHQIHAIDNHPEVIEVAKQYFYANTIPNLTIMQNQAERYIFETQTDYQHLLIDLANAHRFPEACCNATFFRQCFERLKPGGYLAINLANPDEQQKVISLLRAVFSHATLCIPIKNTTNMVILACQSRAVEDVLNLVYQPGLKINQLVWDAEWGYICSTRPKSAF